MDNSHKWYDTTVALSNQGWSDPDGGHDLPYTGRVAPLADTLMVTAVLLVAGLIHGAAGFGSGLFSMGVLVTAMPVARATVIVAIVSIFISLLNLWTVRKSTPWRQISPTLVTAMPATLLGAYLLTKLDVGILRRGVAAMILLGCAVTLWPPGRGRSQRAFPWAYIAGLVGGTFQGALNMGGPPIVLYVLLRGWSKSAAKGYMSVCFAAMTILRIAFLSVTGVATSDSIRLGLLAVGPALIAAFIGTRIFRRMSNRAFRCAAILLLAGLAANIFLT